MFIAPIVAFPRAKGMRFLAVQDNNKASTYQPLQGVKTTLVTNSDDDFVLTKVCKDHFCHRTKQYLFHTLNLVRKIYL